MHMHKLFSSALKSPLQKVALGFSLTSTLCSPLYAAIELPDILVSSQRATSLFQEHIGPVQVITEEEIKSSGAKHLSQVLEGQLGIQLRDLFSDGSDVVVAMRGFSGNASANSLILVDGRRLNEGDLSAPNINSIPIADIERIEILPSSSGTLWGEQAVGGVVHIITKAPEQNQTRVSLLAGSHNNKQLSASHEQLFAKRLQTKASLSYQSSDGYRDRNQYEKSYLSLEATLPYEKNTLSGEYTYHDHWAELPGAINNTKVEQDRKQAQFFLDERLTHNHVLRLNHERWMDILGLLTTDLTFRHTDIEGVLGNVSFTQKRQAASLNPRWIHTFDTHFKEGIITFGLDLESFFYDIKSAFGESHAHQKMAALYTHANVPLSNSVNLNIGSRYAFQNATLDDKNVFPDDKVVNNRAWVGEFGLKYTPNHTWSFYLKSDRNFRFPKVDEQLFTKTPIGGKSRVLKTQTGISLEAGLEYQSENTRVSVHGYELWLENEIDFDPSTRNSFGFLGANNHLDPTRRQGLLTKAQHQPCDWLTLEGIYQWTDARFRHGAFSGKRVPFVAKHSLRLAAQAEITETLDFALETQTMSNRYALNDNANHFRKLGGITLVNASLIYELGSLQLSLIGKNLSNKKTHNLIAAQIGELFFYPAELRSFWMTLEWHGEG